MLRLIALLCVVPFAAPIFPDEVYRLMDEIRPPDDLSVSPEERALRDLIPGWEPVRALTEDEMVRPWSAHRMLSGGFHEVGARYKPVPTIPTAWTADWPEPAPLEPTGVPRGWWWMPAEPELRGIWLVLSPGTRSPYSVSFDMVTTPLRAVDLSKKSTAFAMNDLYAALRDREAERRGVDPATLDREAKALEAGVAVPSAADEAIARARSLWREDRFEDAVELLERLVDEDAGTLRDRAKMLAMVSDSYNQFGETERAIEALRRARPLFEEAGMRRVLPVIDDKVRRLGEMGPLLPETRLVLRGKVNAQAGNDGAARRWLEEALRGVDEEADPQLAHDARAALAPVYARLGEREAAIATARAALASAVALGLADEAASMRALLAGWRAEGAPRP